MGRPVEAVRLAVAERMKRQGIREADLYEGRERIGSAWYQGRDVMGYLDRSPVSLVLLVAVPRGEAP